jgi:hypothetical protein
MSLEVRIMSKASRPVSIRVPCALDAEVKTMVATSRRSYADTFVTLARLGLAWLQRGDLDAGASPFSLAQGESKAGNGRDNGSDERESDGNGDELEDDDILEAPTLPVVPPVPSPDPPPIAAKPDRIHAPELSQQLKAIAYAIIQTEFGDLFVGEKTILRENLWFVLTPDPRRRLNALLERAAREGAGRRFTNPHLDWLREHIGEDPEMVELMAAEGAARRQGQSILKIVER